MIEYVAITYVQQTQRICIYILQLADHSILHDTCAFALTVPS